MDRTRTIFIVIVIVAILVAGISLGAQWLRGKGPTSPTSQALEVRVVSALPVEPFVSEAARTFNDEHHKLEGRTIHVTITPMDGLTAMGMWDRGEMNPVPTAWIPDSRYLVELVNAAYKDKGGRDVFLSDGEYRA
jgi:hypothetical protein